MEGEMLNVPMIPEMGTCMILRETRKAECLFQVDLELEQ